VSESPITHVSDTAFWVATYRANETARPDGLFRDPLAERLVAGRGRRIAAQMADGALVEWVVVIRTLIIDELIARVIAAGCDVVLNLGAGLDTRPYRMALPASLLWVEVDFPDVISFKEARLAGELPRCRLERVRLDLGQREARRGLFREIAARATKVLVLTEGVVAYLANDEVATLADDLHAEPRFAHWVLESRARQFLWLAHLTRIRRARQMARAPLKFMPDDWTAFFAARGWTVAETRYVAEEGRRYGRRPPIPSWVRLLIRLIPRRRRAALLRGAGYVLMQRS
jgi:methyltransferase (TIGR00027 family)